MRPGRLIVAANQLDRAKIHLARALSIDPGTPHRAHRHAQRRSSVRQTCPRTATAAVTQGIAARPEVLA